MKRLQMIAVVLLAALALCAVAVSSAWAISPAPYWSVGGTRLVAGKTHNVAAHIVKPFVLTTPEEGSRIECSALTAERAVLLGSNEGTPGRGSGIAKFSGCTIKEGLGEPNCELSEGGTITTNPLIAEQVESVSGSGGGKQLLEDIFPANGSNFVTLHFVGSNCTVKETAVSGQIVAESLLDSAAETGKIELGQAPREGTSGLLRLPPTAIKEVWLIANGEGKIVKTKLLAFGDVATETGTTLGLLANTKFEPVYALWSALP